MSSNTTSYRVTFNLNNPQHIREYNMISGMSKKDRNEFIHLCISLIGRKLGYRIPEDGLLGIVAGLMGNTESVPPAPVPIVPIAPKKKPTQRTTVTQRKPPEPPKEALPPSPMDADEEPSDVSAMIQASLLGI